MLHFLIWTGSNEQVQSGATLLTQCARHMACDMCRKADITRLLPGWLARLVNPLMAKDWLDLAATPLSELLDELTQVRLLSQAACWAGAGYTESEDSC